MDEVLEKLGTTLISSNANESGKTNFEELYKNWGKLGNQEQRRQELLDVQKSERQTKLDKFRGILDLVNTVERNDVYKHHKATYRPSIYVAGFTKTSPTYSNVLMLSEWMIEKPEDFQENWLVTPCPKGVRTLVIASQGSTKCYTKFGHFRLECHTELPGGNPSQVGCNTRCCILDCFHVESMHTMFVLDLLAWNSQPMTDGETQFRHFWLQTHLEEICGLKQLSKRNKLIFKLLPKVPCTPKSFDEFMMKVPHFENYSPLLDGLLFYHKKAHYFAGETPLVGWLYPYMVPEVIGTDVKINPVYMLEKPIDYAGQADFIEKFEGKCAKKREKIKKTIPMDVASVTKENENTEKSETPPTDDMEADATQATPETTQQNKTEESLEKME